MHMYAMVRGPQRSAPDRDPIASVYEKLTAQCVKGYIIKIHLSNNMRIVNTSLEAVTYIGKIKRNSQGNWWRFEEYQINL